MESADIPFGAGQESGWDELAGASPAAWNCLTDEAGTIRARPGISAWSDYPSTIPHASAVVAMGLLNGALVYATKDGRVYGLPTAGQVSGGSDATEAVIAGSLRPSLAMTKDIAVAVAGGAPQKLSGVVTSSRLSGSPPDAVDVAVVARRLVLAGVRTGKYYWSGILEPGVETWDTGIEFREAETKSDDIVALKAVARELFVFGSESVQGFVPDEQRTFAPSTDLDVGCLAGRSIVRWGNSFAWLDHEKQLVLSDGRALPQEGVLSRPIASILRSMETVSDCWGTRIQIGSHDLLTWFFPSEGRCFSVDMTTRRWSEWFSWSRGRRTKLDVHSHLWWPARGVHLVGLGTGQIAQLTMDAHTDLGGAVHWTSRTGFVDRGTGLPKEPDTAYLTVRRGEAASAESLIRLRWRDDLGDFCAPIDITLGTPSDSRCDVEIAPLGAPYGHRQWELSSTAAEACVVARARETFVIQGGD